MAVCCAAVLQADGLLQRHSHLPLVNEAAAVLVHASKHGPAALQVRLTLATGVCVRSSCLCCFAHIMQNCACAVGSRQQR
jgi:hypothetical protein